MKPAPHMRGWLWEIVILNHQHDESQTAIKHLLSCTQLAHFFFFFKQYFIGCNFRTILGLYVCIKLLWNNNYEFQGPPGGCALLRVVQLYTSALAAYSSDNTKGNLPLHFCDFFPSLGEVCVSLGMHHHVFFIRCKLWDCRSVCSTPSCRKSPSYL